MDRRVGMRQRTVVIFASDNGGTRSGSNAPLSGHKGGTYEGGIRVPAIARWPGVIPPQTVSDQPCITFDFTASIARLAGVQPPPEIPLEGIDILQHVAEGRPQLPRTLFWRKPRGETLWKGVRQGNWKYVASREPAGEKEFLFDLASDPAEQTDLRAARPQDHARLRSLYDRWETTVREHRRGRPSDVPDAALAP